MLLEVAPDIEARVLHRRVERAAETARAHPFLHTLADLPVLAIHDVPEIDDITRVKSGLSRLGDVKQEFAGDAREIRTLGPEREGRHVLGRCAEEQIWIT